MVSDMKYVVLAREIDSGMIVDSFGVFKKKKNALTRLAEIKDCDFEYVVEEVDPFGSYADDECEDE